MTYELSPRVSHGDNPRRAALPVPPDAVPKPQEYHTLQLLAIGTPYAVNSCRNRLYTLGYAQLTEWSRPLPIVRSQEVIRSARPDEVMRILTKRIPLPSQR